MALQAEVVTRTGNPIPAIELKEAESHVPTLKNEGKSDCTIWIIGITDVKHEIPRSQLCEFQNSECKNTITVEED
jgi:hypothetical protein